MKALKYFFAVLFAASIALGCTGMQGDGTGNGGQDQEPGRASDLLTLFYQTIEKQNGENPREKVYIVAHRANTLNAILANVPD